MEIFSVAKPADGRLFHHEGAGDLSVGKTELLGVRDRFQRIVVKPGIIRIMPIIDHGRSRFKGGHDLGWERLFFIEPFDEFGPHFCSELMKLLLLIH